jgi:hypothetical protein
MVSTRIQTILASQAIGMMLLLSQGCGLVGNSGSTATCSTGTAQIGVYDGTLQKICGCLEAAGYSNNITCTVSAGTVVYFNFIGISNDHQIVISNANQCVFSVRHGSAVTQTDACPMNSTGTFNFSDTYNISVGGTIVVQ